MWLEIICGLVIFKLFCCCCSGGDNINNLLDFDFSASGTLFSVASRLEKLYDGKAYVGLRIPDPDTGSRQHIDFALVAKGKVFVVSVKNFAGFISRRAGSSGLRKDDSRNKEQSHPDPVAKANKAASILESYLKRRGVALSTGRLPNSVVLPDPELGSLNLQLSGFCPPPEVITYEKSKSTRSGWIKEASRGAKKEMQEPMHQRLSFVLGTAPMWDRLELKGKKFVLGEFLEFKGGDSRDLKNIKRSKIGCLKIEPASLFGIALSRFHVSCYSRDCRSEEASSSERKLVSVSSSTAILFRSANSSEVGKVELSSVVSMTLSA